MSSFPLTRDDFVKLGRFKEWDKYENDYERILRFFIDGVKLTFDELSTIGHKKDYREILNENKRRKERDDHKRLTPDLERRYNQRDYVEYYPPEKCVASAIDDFCTDISMLFFKCPEYDIDTIGYDFVIRLAGLIPYVINQEPELAGSLIGSLFDFRDEVAKSLENWPDSGYPSISGSLFENIGFMGMKVLDAYFDKVMKVIQDIRDKKIDLEETIKRMWNHKYWDIWSGIVYTEARKRESDHQGELTQCMAWRLAQAVLNGEIDFAEYLVNNDDILVSISRNYGRKSKALDAKAKKVREEFYKPEHGGLPPQIYAISFRTFKKYEKRSRKPISSATEAKERKKWFFLEIPSLDNSPSNFVKLLKKYLNRKYRKKHENND